MDQQSQQWPQMVVAEIRRHLAGHRAPLLVALDGASGAGKSSLAAAFGATRAIVVAGDVFFANDRSDAAWDACTPAERADHCIDWQRLRTEALAPLLAGRAAAWHPFDFARPGAGVAAHVVTRRPVAVIILDGVYSCRPELADLIDLSVLVDTPASVRVQRHGARDGTGDAVWHVRWDPAEDYYLTHMRPPSSFDVMVASESGANL